MIATSTSANVEITMVCFAGGGGKSGSGATSRFASTGSATGRYRSKGWKETYGF